MAKEQETALLRIELRVPGRGAVPVMIPSGTDGTGGLVRELERTTFRMTDERLAWRLSHWRNATELFADALIRERLIDSLSSDIGALAADPERGTVRGVLTINCGTVVGWECTCKLDSVPVDVLEEYIVKDRKKGLRVLASRPDIKAPTTKLVTMHYDLALVGAEWRVEMRVIRPGYDFGHVRALTAKSGRVAFLRSHPGA